MGKAPRGQKWVVFSRGYCYIKPHSLHVIVKGARDRGEGLG
jgi:hypothetical protein